MIYCIGNIAISANIYQHADATVQLYTPPLLKVSAAHFLKHLSCCEYLSAGSPTKLNQADMG